MRLLILAGLLQVSPAIAQTALPTLSATQAEAIIAGCKSHAAAKRQSHAVVVLDAGGTSVASLRMDGNRAGILAFAEAKAKAVANWGFSTAQMAESARGTPGFDRAPFVVVTPGGVPVYAADGRSFIGAVGVSGEAPSDDAACAEAGIRAARLLPARRP